MHACMHAFIQRNRGVSSPLTDHPLPISSIPRRGQRKISKSVQRSSPSGRVQKMHKIIGAPIIETPLFEASRFLQKQSHSSRHGTRPIPRWRSSTSSSSSSHPPAPFIPRYRTTRLEGIFFSSESTNACRSFHEIFDEPRARLPGEESIDPLARRPKEYLSGCWFAAIYEPCTSYLDVQSHQFVDPSRFRPSVHTPSYTLLRYSMVLAATDVWIKAWLGGGGKAVRVKKNAESRCYGGWKEGGGKRKTRAGSSARNT